uniref:Uncharacterized protein n=1 Tax=Oryza barthii TaxID=65489 RepID=A0A0D3EV07_9ORYZ
MIGKETRKKKLLVGRSQCNRTACMSTDECHLLPLVLQYPEEDSKISLKRPKVAKAMVAEAELWRLANAAIPVLRV